MLLLSTTAAAALHLNQRPASTKQFTSFGQTGSSTFIACLAAFMQRKGNNSYNK